MTAYYNEFDPFAAEWLRALIAAGHIAPGDVDTRSITDVRPDDLKGYTQCHFFAGIGVWSYALRRAGWADNRPVWTGSCPCQPFSAAGKGDGFADERHLWPHFHHLIGQCRPDVVFGEQVASKDGLGWLDLVQADLEGSGYASGAVDLCAAGVGAPHIRQRLWWVGERLADAASGGSGTGLCSGGSTEHGRVQPADNGAVCHVEHTPSDGRQQRWSEPSWRGASGGCCVGGLDHHHHHHTGLEGQRGGHNAAFGQWTGSVRPVAETGELGGVADDLVQQRQGGQPGKRVGYDAGGRVEGSTAIAGLCGDLRPGPTNGVWRDADWLFCRDGKWRPVSPKPQPLVDGSAASLGRVCAGHVQEIEEAINAWAVETESDPYQALRDMQQYLKSAAQREWPVGGLPRLHAPPFLLALLRQLTEQGWGFAECLSVSREETFEDELRVLRYEERLAGASRQHGLDGQSPGEHSNPLHFLSSLLARYAHTAWGHAYQTYTEIGFPLAHGARSRVGRLRGYGNAIVAEAAVAFIEAYEESRAERRDLRLTTSGFTTDSNLLGGIFE